MKNFISIDTCSLDELNELLTLSADLKKIYKGGRRDICLAGKTLAMVFEKSSLRTRISFQVAMTDLGGNGMYLKPDDIGKIGQREPAKDMARVFSRLTDGIMARTYSHQAIVDLAKFADVPVINALSDWSHPCQAMADLLTIQEHCGGLSGLKVAYVGDGNNVARSLAFACAKFGMKLDIASPVNYQLDEQSIESANSICENTVRQLDDAGQAVEDACVIYTDTWVSMGQEEEKKQRIADFKGYQVNSELVGKAPADVRIMHCLPAYRGLEITDEVAESDNSVIFDQAENRLHFQRALLKYLMS